MRSGCLVSITIVTFNSARHIRRCLEAVLAQSWLSCEVIVVDNASSDGTRHELEPFSPAIHIVWNDRNAGFAGGQNQAIACAHGDWILTLNPDVIIASDFIEQLVLAGEPDSTIGTMTGKLLATNAAQPTLDSTGIYFTPELRHLDRGSRELDRGQYDRPEYVFGATGAAALYRRAMIDDISLDGEFFDDDFFIYREDADVAWRAQLMGWRCLYHPLAIGYHVRRVLPDRRASLPAEINMHSVKNRFLMQIKNLDSDLFRKFALPIIGRDLVVIAACVLWEHSSLAAFGRLRKLWPRALAKRRLIQSHRRAAPHQIEHWFRSQPAALPAPDVMAERIGAAKL